MTARDSRPIAPSNPAERAPGCCDRYRTPAIAIAHLTLGSGEVSGPQALTSLQKTSLSARLSTPNGTPEDRFVLHQEWIVALDPRKGSHVLHAKRERACGSQRQPDAGGPLRRRPGLSSCCLPVCKQARRPSKPSASNGGSPFSSRIGARTRMIACARGKRCSHAGWSEAQKLCSRHRL